MITLFEKIATNPKVKKIHIFSVKNQVNKNVRYEANIDYLFNNSINNLRFSNWTFNELLEEIDLFLTKNT